MLISFEYHKLEYKCIDVSILMGNMKKLIVSAQFSWSEYWKTFKLYTPYLLKLDANAHPYVDIILLDMKVEFIIKILETFLKTKTTVHLDINCKVRLHAEITVSSVWIPRIRKLQNLR